MCCIGKALAGAGSESSSRNSRQEIISIHCENGSGVKKQHSIGAKSMHFCIATIPFLSVKKIHK